MFPLLVHLPFLCCQAKSVFFLDYQICMNQNQKSFFFYLLLPYFWNIQSKFSNKGKSIAPNTVKYFQEYRWKGYSKIKRFAFCLIIGCYVKFLSPNIIYMQVNSYFFPEALLEQVGSEAFVFNFRINKIIHSFRSSLLLI